MIGVLVLPYWLNSFSAKSSGSLPRLPLLPHKAHRILAMHTEEKQPLIIPNSMGRENSKMEGI